MHIYEVEMGQLHLWYGYIYIMIFVDSIVLLQFVFRTIDVYFVRRFSSQTYPISIEKYEMM